MQTISVWWMWLGFFILIGTMLAVDLLLLGGKRSHQVSNREALAWVIIWVTIALSFNLLLWGYLVVSGQETVANQRALEFFTGYLIEKSLSVDNLFVFIMIFNYFSVPAEYQRKVLFLGVLGAIILRLLMIFLGVWLVAKFHWILLIFGLFLVLTGIKMLIFAEHKPELNKNPLVNWLKKHLKITHEFHGEKFFVIEQGVRHATPLFLVLILIEFSDLIFALDSIPAIFAVTNDPFIVVTSNIFAILGLRSLYFLLANMANRFTLLKYGIAIILIFVGSKMLIAPWVKIHIGITLGFIVLVLASCVLMSLRLEKTRPYKKS